MCLFSPGVREARLGADDVVAVRERITTPSRSRRWAVRSSLLHSSARAKCSMHADKLFAESDSFVACARENVYTSPPAASSSSRRSEQLGIVTPTLTPG